MTDTAFVFRSVQPKMDNGEDRTKRKKRRGERVLRASQTGYEAAGDRCLSSIATRLMEEMRVAVLLIGGQDGVVRYVNNCVCRDLGKQNHELLGRHYKEFFHPEFASFYQCLAIACKDENEHTGIYYWAERALWEQVTVHQIRVDNEPCLLLTISNVTEITLSQYMTENVAYFDNLLKLPNGAKLEEDINTLASVETVALLYITVSGLREINNLYGWHSGDNLLTQIRDWLLFSEPRSAQLYRLEDGFAIMGRCVSIEDAKERAESIERRFAQPWTLPLGSRNISLYCSIRLGIVHGKYMKNEMRNLLLRTIEAARDQTGYVIYDEEVDRKARWMLKIRDSLINCIHNGMKGFELHYQPIVETKTGHWIAVEALCRWTTPDGARIPPDVFIRLAEQLGLIGELDAWVRKKAMQQCVSIGLHKRDFTLDLNFSPTQKISASFVVDLCATLSQTGFPANKLNLEIVESARIPFDDENLNGLSLIGNQGIHLSLDDFGTGYSSLENLIRISAHIIKTDKLFLDDIEGNPYRQYLLQMLVELAARLNMQVVAEGVETEEQFRLLRGYGVDFIQGYLFSKPLTYAQLGENVDRFRTETQTQ